MTSDALAYAINWLRDHWDYPPQRLHSSAVDDGSAWGAPAFSRAFERWIGEHPCKKIDRTIQQACSHRGGAVSTCTDCNGLSVKTMFVTRYQWPMRAAMFNLWKHVHMPPRTIHYASAVYMLVLLDFDAQATCAALGMPEERGEAFLVDAINRLRGRYSEGPVGRPRGISDSQAIAEAALAA